MVLEIDEYGINVHIVDKYRHHIFYRYLLFNINYNGLRLINDGTIISMEIESIDINNGCLKIIGVDEI